MKRRILSSLMALVLVFGLLPATVFAAGGMGTAVYVRSDGNDTTGDGSADKPYATLAKAVDAANDGAIFPITNGIAFASSSFVILKTSSRISEINVFKVSPYCS